MKKAVSLILALVLCLGLCACSNAAKAKEEMMKELKTGTWTQYFTFYDQVFSQEFQFKNGEKLVYFDGTGQNFIGTYEVTDTSIYCTATDTTGELMDWNFYYTYEDGHLEITLQTDSGTEWQLVHNP